MDFKKDSKELPRLEEISLEEIMQNVDRDFVEKAVRESEEKLRNYNFKTAGMGVVMETSTCCGAPVTYSGGGVVIPLCSVCGKEYNPVIVIESKGY